MQLSILVMIAGAIIAGTTDLTFSLPGYIWVAICAVSTAAYLLLIKYLKDETGETSHALPMRFLDIGGSKHQHGPLGRMPLCILLSLCLTSWAEGRTKFQGVHAQAAQGLLTLSMPFWHIWQFLSLAAGEEDLRQLLVCRAQPECAALLQQSSCAPDHAPVPRLCNR